jgi:hypothetical protein
VRSPRVRDGSGAAARALTGRQVVSAGVAGRNEECDERSR